MNVIIDTVLSMLYHSDLPNEALADIGHPLGGYWVGIEKDVGTCMM